MKIDPSKKYRTRDGQEVTRLTFTFGSPTYSWEGYVGGKPRIWTVHGVWCVGAPSGLDLVEVVPETPAFDPTKPVQTRDGRKAGIYSTDNPGPYPVHGWIQNVNGSRAINCWTSAGGLLAVNAAPSLSDLVNIPPPPPLTGYLNIYPRGEIGAPRSTRAEADEVGTGRIACVKWTEGQFDE